MTTTLDHQAGSTEAAIINQAHIGRYCGVQISAGRCSVLTGFEGAEILRTQVCDDDYHVIEPGVSN